MQKRARLQIITWVFPGLYCLLTLGAFIDRAQCSSDFLDLCDLGILVIALPWIRLFDYEAARAADTLLPVYGSIALNGVSLYMLGRVLAFALQKGRAYWSKHP